MALTVLHATNVMAVIPTLKKSNKIIEGYFRLQTPGAASAIPT